MLKISLPYSRLFGQTYAMPIAIKPITLDERTPKQFMDYLHEIDCASRYETRPAGEYLRILFMGQYGIPFVYVVPNDDGAYNWWKDHLRKEMEIHSTTEPKPFGKDMYRCQEK